MAFKLKSGNSALPFKMMGSSPMQSKAPPHDHDPPHTVEDFQMGRAITQESVDRTKQRKEAEADKDYDQNKVMDAGQQVADSESSPEGDIMQTQQTYEGPKFSIAHLNEFSSGRRSIADLSDEDKRKLAASVGADSRAPKKFAESITGQLQALANQ
tara:strand:- start:55 stop:522 length:468 start_codon:yes stop_codon:yes gene_type:complete